jgi:hypothetical protein
MPVIAEGTPFHQQALHLLQVTFCLVESRSKLQRLSPGLFLQRICWTGWSWGFYYKGKKGFWEEIKTGQVMKTCPVFLLVGY